MSLNAGGQLGISDTEIEHILATWDTFDQSELEITRMGFPPEEKPNFSCPQIVPGTLERLTGDQLTNLYSQIVAWHGYASNVLMRMKGKEAQIDNSMKVIKAQNRRNMRAIKQGVGGKAASKESMDDDLLLNPQFQELMKEGQKLEQQRLQIQAHVDSLDTRRSLISRFVEIKRQELEGGIGHGSVRTTPARTPGVMR
jgi:hypothetical protein